MDACIGSIGAGLSSSGMNIHVESIIDTITIEDINGPFLKISRDSILWVIAYLKRQDQEYNTCVCISPSTSLNVNSFTVALTTTEFSIQSRYSGYAEYYVYLFEST